MTEAPPVGEQEAPGLPGASDGRFRPLVRFLDITAQAICVGSLAVLFSALFVNVLMRYLLRSGLDWAYDIHVILFPWMIAAGAVLASIHGRHVSITLLRDNTSRAVARWIYLLACALVLTISVIVIWSSYPIMMAARFQRVPALGGISQLWGYLSITYAFTAIAVLSLIDGASAVMAERDVRQADATRSLS